ncbi:hypothetical protein [Burkholderia mallei]|uniref:hypothetical protein n=1 Tax=Burkholderia mallei TaxID=13373 RepID=UPI003BEF4A0F
MAKAKSAGQADAHLLQDGDRQGRGDEAGGHDVHGAALGAEEIAKTRDALGWKWAPFVIPQEVYAAWDAKEAGKRREGDWNAAFAQYRAKYPAEAAEFERRMAGKLPPTGPRRPRRSSPARTSAARRSRRARRRSRRSRALPPCCPSCSAARPT